MPATMWETEEASEKAEDKLSGEKEPKKQGSELNSTGAAQNAPEIARKSFEKVMSGNFKMPKDFRWCRDRFGKYPPKKQNR